MLSAAVVSHCSGKLHFHMSSLLQLEGLIFAPHFPWNFDHGFW